jgi:hypothetical protein
LESHVWIPRYQSSRRLNSRHQRQL